MINLKIEEKLAVFCCMIILCKSQNIQTLDFHRYPKNLIFYTAIQFDTFSTQTLISCAKLCANTNGCLTFTYAKVTGVTRCQGHSLFIGKMASSAVTKADAKTFYREPYGK